MTASPVLRFAPSPNGDLHPGHALSAILAHDAAIRLGGRFLLRIEDIDPARSKRTFEAGILRDLAWLGLSWETPVRRQSEHMSDYRAAAGRLAVAGLLYACDCSRADIARVVADREAGGAVWPRDPDGAPLYPGTCRPARPSVADVTAVSAGGRALRLDMDRAIAAASAPLHWVEHGDRFYARDFNPAEPGRFEPAAPAAWGDVVICRKDTPTSYHLSVVVDDTVQSITHVTRGLDLFPATSVHRLLQDLLGLPQPAYAHHRLLTTAGGRKLSKSDGDMSLKALREEGATPADIRRMAGLAD